MIDFSAIFLGFRFSWWVTLSTVAEYLVEFSALGEPIDSLLVVKFLELGFEISRGKGIPGWPP